MNSRRLICAPLSRGSHLPHCPRKSRVAHRSKFGGQCLSWVKLDRVGRGDPSIHVRNTANTDHKFNMSASVALCPGPDSCKAANGILFDHFVRACEQPRRAFARQARQRLFPLRALPDPAWTCGRPSVMLAKEKSTSPETTAAVEAPPPLLNGMCTTLMPVRAWNSSTE